MSFAWASYKSRNSLKRGSEKSSNKAGGSLHNTTHSYDALEIAVPGTGYEYILIFSLVYNTLFTFETIARLITCPSKRHFFSSLLNLIDVGSALVKGQQNQTQSFAKTFQPIKSKPLKNHQGTAKI
jgi:hypothetical protein